MNIDSNEEVIDYNDGIVDDFDDDRGDDITELDEQLATKKRK